MTTATLLAVLFGLIGWIPAAVLCAQQFRKLDSDNLDGPRLVAVLALALWLFMFAAAFTVPVIEYGHEWWQSALESSGHPRKAKP